MFILLYLIMTLLVGCSVGISCGALWGITVSVALLALLTVITGY